MARVLVADDDALTRRFIEETLAFAGHQVSSVPNGSAAIASVDAPGCFDAVITDYAMPHANGVDVVAHAQRIDPVIPCIVVTAFRELDLAMQAMQAGAVAFIPKPFTALHLLTVLDRALERRELADEAMRLAIPRADARAIHHGARQRARVQGLRDAGALEPPGRHVRRDRPASRHHGRGAQHHPLRRLPARHRQGVHPRGAAAQARCADRRGARDHADASGGRSEASSPTSTPGRTCV